MESQIIISSSLNSWKTRDKQVYGAREKEALNGIVFIF